MERPHKDPHKKNGGACALHATHNDNKLVKELVMTHVNRVVIGANKDKKSAIIYRDSSNHQEVPDLYWRSTLWARP